jgi:hypothetical protein
MKRLPTLLVLGLLLTAIVFSNLIAADSTVAPKTNDDDYVIAVYPIRDLVARTPRDLPFRRATWPESALENTFKMEVTCGGTFLVDDYLDEYGPEATRQEMIDSLEDTITENVFPESWGDPATIRELNGILIIRQSPEAHEQIVDILATLREFNVVSFLTVHARWVRLSAAEFCEISDGSDGGALVLEGDLLDRVSDNVEYAGQTSCLMGQLVHLATGSITSLPVASEPLISANAVAYNITHSAILSGALLEVRPKRQLDDGRILFHVTSTISNLAAANEFTPITGVGSEDGNVSSPSVTLMLPKLIVHNLTAAPLVPLDEYVLVGAMTAPEDNGQSEDVLCLILRVTRSEEE